MIEYFYILFWPDPSDCFFLSRDSFYIYMKEHMYKSMHIYFPDPCY
jgi:hypothetical protein